ncbi:DUF1819 family protein [Psychrobacter sanguinis]|uniref:DUF1819 family protein n=1 Tax=Psychrobacter sanguinis TaxID=861445 RepID=UPI00191822C7|nr:DUF1819 family protein [Psychrobacter sanguinis]UEC25537.1 DUF1819 family protein [Psychrobacter sanguinis]
MIDASRGIHDIRDYVGDLIGGSLLIAETRIIAETLLKQLPEDEWRALVIDQNILQKKSVKTSSRYVRVIRTRIEGLGKDFMSALVTSTERAYIQLLLVAVMINSPIVEDFMRLSLAEAKRTYKPNLPSTAWQDFYETQSLKYPDLNNYSESTIKKLGTNVIKILVLSGYLSDARKREIYPVYLMPEVKEWLLRLDRADLIEVMECTL